MSKKVTIDIDWASEMKDLDKKLSKEYGIKIEDKGRMNAIVTGDSKKIKEFLLGPDYGMDSEDIKELFPELSENSINKMKTFAEFIMEAITKPQFDKLMKDLKHVKREVEADGMDFDDSMAFEMADNFLRDTNGLEEYIKKHIGAKDVKGWLANQM